VAAVEVLVITVVTVVLVLVLLRAAVLAVALTDYAAAFVSRSCFQA